MLLVSAHPSHVGVRWLTQPTLSSLLTMHFQFWQPIWQVQRLYSSISVPHPSPPVSPTRIPRPITRKNFKTFKAYRRWNSCQAHAVMPWAHDGEKHIITRLISQSCHLSRALPLGVKEACGGSETSTSRAWWGVPRTISSAPPPMFSKGTSLSRVQMQVLETQIFTTFSQIFYGCFWWLFLICKNCMGFKDFHAFQGCFENEHDKGKMLRASPKWEVMHTGPTWWLVVAGDWMFMSPQNS